MQTATGLGKHVCSLEFKLADLIKLSKGERIVDKAIWGCDSVTPYVGKPLSLMLREKNKE